MKYLNQFLKFDWELFSKNKRFVSIGKRHWTNFETKEHLGTLIDAIIYKDDTPYKQKEGEITSNAYEKVTFKVAKDIDIPMNVEIQATNVDATVYGDFREKLSITAEDITVVSKKKES